MKTAQHVDVQRSQTLAGEIAPVAARCYWNAYRAALTIGAGAVAYFASSRRVYSQVAPDALPLHVHDRQADRRHQRTMHRALTHMLTLAPTWATIVAAADPPIV